MPNKRKEGRRTASVVLDDETWQLLKAEANKRGTNISNLLEELALKNFGKQNENSKNNTKGESNPAKGSAK